MAFAAGEFDAAFADEGVVAFGQVDDEAMGVGEAGGVLDFGEGCGGAAIGDIFGEGAVEQDGFLGDDGDLGAQGFLGCGGDVGVVDADFA